MSAVKNVYTSIACNRTPEAADWGQNGLIAFAACNSIAILNPQVNCYMKSVTIIEIEYI